LHPERAKKYSYCMAPECQEKNSRGLTMVAIGMNKSADELMVLDERTREELASGKFRDQRRGSFGTSPATPASQAPRASQDAPGPQAAAGSGAASPERPARPARQHGSPPPPAPRPARRAWTQRQERLALLYNEQGLRPDEIAGKLGVSTYTATQIVLAARGRQQ
jgi:hypothetical protein